MAHGFAVREVQERLEAANGGYEIVHRSPRLEIGVYVLVAPEADTQQPHEDDEVYVVLSGRGALEVEGNSFSFAEGFSLMVTCETQAEIDKYWSKLTADGGEEGPCGWLKDKFGLSWQVTPAVMEEMLAGKDQAKIARVTQAFLKMKKFDIEALKRAYGS